MAFLGLRVALSPDSAPKKIAWGLGLAILIATVGLLIGFISTKTFNRSNLLPIVETFIFMILGACMIIFAKKFGVMLEETVCFAIIISSVINLLCLKNLNDIQSKLDARMEAQRARSLAREYASLSRTTYARSDSFKTAIYMAEAISQDAYDRILQNDKHFNEMNHGKWRHLMSSNPRNLLVFQAPTLPAS